MKTWIVPDDGKLTRLDRFLHGAGAASSRERVQKLIEAGYVRVGEETVRKVSRLLKPGENVSAEPQAETAPETVAPVAGPLEVVFEDRHLIVINKPRGVVMHPGAGTRNPTLVEHVLAHTKLSPLGAPLRPGIVHRIDKDTSGLVVLAKTEPVHQSLAKLFSSHDIVRIYDGLVWGQVKAASGTIETRIGRHATVRTRFASVKTGGKRAVTHWKRTSVNGPLSHLRFKLETGRTHQIRVHSAEMGHPLVGDPVYGRRKPPLGLPEGLQKAISALPGQALHAGVLGFVHPVTKRKLRFEAPMPADMTEVLNSAGI